MRGCLANALTSHHHSDDAKNHNTVKQHAFKNKARLHLLTQELTTLMGLLFRKAAILSAIRSKALCLAS